MRLVATTVVRESVRGKQRSGYVYDVDWAAKRVLRRFPVPEPSYPESDDNPRGGARGGRGVAATRHGIVLANYDTVYVYDDEWNVLDSFSHPLFIGIHELDWDGEVVWISATRNDTVLRVTLDGSVEVAWDPHRSELARRFRLRERLHPLDGSVDYRKRDAPGVNECHVNGVTRRGGSLIVNCGLIRGRRPTAARIARGARQKLGLGRDDAGRSAVVRVTGGGSAEILLELATGHWPTHNGQLLDDSRLIVNESHKNTLRVFSLEDRRQLAKVTVPGTWLRGLHAIGPGRILVGTAPAAIALVDLEAGAAVERVTLSDDPNEAIHGLTVCPPPGERP
jgi:hypothetical protein